MFPPLRDAQKTKQNNFVKQHGLDTSLHLLEKCTNYVHQNLFSYISKQNSTSIISWCPNSKFSVEDVLGQYPSFHTHGLACAKLLSPHMDESLRGWEQLPPAPTQQVLQRWGGDLDLPHLLLIVPSAQDSLLLLQFTEHFL